MKELLFTSYNMSFGGIERALLNILKNIDYTKYNVTLLLEKKEGELLTQVPSNVIVREYRISEVKNILFRKIINRLKIIFFIILHYRKYDFSACFATYSIPMSIIVRYLSKNNYIWVHSNYKKVYNNDLHKIKTFFYQRKINKFNKIIFVSNEAKDDFISCYPNLVYKCSLCNNLINYKEILELSEESISFSKDNSKVFLHVGRHSEQEKKITRLINTCNKLAENNYNFQLLLIGDGPDHHMYINKVKELNLEKYIKILGAKINPYPYYKAADSFVLTSDYEGFPVVYLESLVFNLPIITTIPVSDDFFNIEDYGIVVEKDEEKIYNALRDFLEGSSIKKKIFNSEEYNRNILLKLEKLFNGENI